LDDLDEAGIGADLGVGEAGDQVYNVAQASSPEAVVWYPYQVLSLTRLFFVGF